MTHDRKIYTQANAESIAEITAFLYAGALQHAKGADFEVWQGHIGFVGYCTEYAQEIDAWLDGREEECYPGVMMYELIEPMGKWLIDLNEPADSEEALDYFRGKFERWIAD